VPIIKSAGVLHSVSELKELCKHYSEDESLRGMRLIDRMLPLDEWQPDHKAEMEAMLEKAARPQESWLL